MKALTQVLQIVSDTDRRAGQELAYHIPQGNQQPALLCSRLLVTIETGEKDSRTL